MNKIVVGVDGSKSSLVALDWAFDEAHRRGAPLVAVAAWQYPAALAAEATGFYTGAMTEELPENARQALEEALASVDHRGVDVTQVVDMGSPARILLDQAADADLLVVGARGLGGFRGLLLGSVSQQCVTHATCPTVIVPLHR
jgi:nucleotide-binding universal stress UspA family protein